MTPLAVTDFTLVTALGVGRGPTLDALRAGRTGLARRDFETARLDAWIGVVDGLDEVRLPPGLEAFDCRNNRLAWLGLQADGFAAAVVRRREKFGARRIGVIVGTSTSGILETEQAYRRRDPATGALPADFRYAETHNTGALGAFVQRALGLEGPAFVVSTACSSSAKAFGSAARLIELGVIDAAVVGGVDSLCLTTLYGFNSLELLSPDACRPWDAQRHGLSLGEGAAFALLERSDGGGSGGSGDNGDEAAAAAATPAPAAWLLGVGESSDGHHMSSPHPEGAGAVEAMRQALAEAGLAPSQVDYLNLHGTATPNNDAVEDLAVRAVFGTDLACSSTKGHTGHTLGAAGAVEAAISLLALGHGFVPGGLHRDHPDPQLHCAYVDRSRDAALSVVASNSFGFGGSNACLVFGAGR